LSARDIGELVPEVLKKEGNIVGLSPKFDGKLAKEIKLISHQYLKLIQIS